MYNFCWFSFFPSRMFEPTFSLFRHFVYLDLSRNLVPRSSHTLRLSHHFEYISILVGNFGHVILLCARVFSRAAAILKSEKTLGTRLETSVFGNPEYSGIRSRGHTRASGIFREPRDKGRTRHNTIGTFVIQRDENKWPGILKFRKKNLPYTLTTDLYPG